MGAVVSSRPGSSRTCACPAARGRQAAHRLRACSQPAHGDSDGPAGSRLRAEVRRGTRRRGSPWGPGHPALRGSVASVLLSPHWPDSPRVSRSGPARSEVHSAFLEGTREPFDQVPSEFDAEPKLSISRPRACRLLLVVFKARWDKSVPKGSAARNTVFHRCGVCFHQGWAGTGTGVQGCIQKPVFYPGKEPWGRAGC